MENNNFWNTPEGKILGHGIHDHTNALGLIKNYLNKINKLQPEGTEEFELVGKIKNQIKILENSIDYIYENIKKLKNNT